MRASWPSTICQVAALHAWWEGVVALHCQWCGEYILYEDCAAYQRWYAYWFAKLANPEAVLN